MGSAFALPAGREGGRKARKTGARMNNGDGEVMVRMQRRSACGSRRVHEGGARCEWGKGRVRDANVSGKSDARGERNTRANGRTRVGSGTCRGKENRGSGNAREEWAYRRREATGEGKTKTGRWRREICTCRIHSMFPDVFEGFSTGDSQRKEWGRARILFLAL